MVELMRAEISDAGAKRGSLVDEAYAALKQAIRETDFPPGYQGSEQEIAVRLGMSRTPVHEAIIRLQEDGLVRNGFKPPRGNGNPSLGRERERKRLPRDRVDFVALVRELGD